jgi:hypothetical protein
VLYQLSYIGSKTQLSARGWQLSAKTSPGYFPLSAFTSECKTSLRRTTVFTANNASTANEARRSFSSVIVFHDKAASTAYATIAKLKRLIRISLPAQTGAQGRIRTSVPR